MHIKHTGKEKLLTEAFSPLLSWSRKQQCDTLQVTSVLSDCVVFYVFAVLWLVPYNSKMFRGEALQICGDPQYLICWVLGVPLKKEKKKKEVRKLPPCLTSFWPCSVGFCAPLCLFRNFLTPFQNQTSEMHWSWAEHKTVFPVYLKSRRLKEQYFHTTVSCLVVQSASTAGQWLNPTAAVESSAIWSTGPRWERYFLTNCFLSLLCFIFGCTLLLTLDYFFWTRGEYLALRRSNGGWYLWVPQRGRCCGRWVSPGYVCIQ